MKKKKFQKQEKDNKAKWTEPIFPTSCFLSAARVVIIIYYIGMQISEIFFGFNIKQTVVIFNTIFAAQILKVQKWQQLN